MRRAAAVAVGLMMFSFTPAQADEVGVIETVQEAADEVVGVVDVAEPGQVVDKTFTIVGETADSFFDDPEEGEQCDVEVGSLCIGCDGSLCPLSCVNPQGIVDLVRNFEGVGQISCGETPGS